MTAKKEQTAPHAQDNEQPKTTRNRSTGAQHAPTSQGRQRATPAQPRAHQQQKHQEEPEQHEQQQDHEQQQEYEQQRGNEQQQQHEQQQQQRGQEQPSDRGQGEAPDSSPDLSHLLQQQISHAIQPVLADFRQQMTRVVQEQLEGEPSTAGNGRGSQQDAQEAQDAGARDERSDVPQSPRQTNERPAQRNQEAEQQQPNGVAAQPGDQAQEPRDARDRATPHLRTALRLAEEQGGHWVQSLLMAGLHAMLAESRRDAVQQHAEHGLHALLSKAFEALPDDTMSHDLQRETERTLQTILRDALDAVFAETTRATIQQQGEAAIRESLHGDFGAAAGDVKDALGALLQAIVDVLRRQWQRVLRLLLKLILTALEGSLTSPEDEEKQQEGTKERSKAGAGAKR